LADRGGIRFLAQRPAELDERDAPEHGGDPERQRPIREHSHARGGQRHVVDRERANQAALDAADAARYRQQAAKLPDDVRDDQDAKRGSATEGREARAERRDVEGEIAERANDHSDPALAQQHECIADAIAKRIQGVA
jgi:hypothetical protein